MVGHRQSVANATDKKLNGWLKLGPEFTYCGWLDGWLVITGYYSFLEVL